MNKIIFVIGVSGCGKSTIGTLLSKVTDIPFFDGDDFHPQSNIDKMTSGKPLVDEDRKQWLLNLNRLALKQSTQQGAIIACSALKESYRGVLKKGLDKQLAWVFLKGSEDLIASRLKLRADHFMPANLLESQFNTLEVPKYGLHVDISQSPDEQVQLIIKELHL